MLHDLLKIVRRKKRLGRGIGGRGAKSGRGMKGQRSRAGSHIRIGFEGGQTPLFRRLPKERGMKRRFHAGGARPIAVSLAQLQHIAAGTIIGPGLLRAHGFLPTRGAKVKIVAGGTGLRSFTIRAHAVTKSAQVQIEAAGGKVEIISQPGKSGARGSS